MDIIQASRVNIKNHRRQYISKSGVAYKCVHEDGCYPHLAKVLIDFNPQLVVELGTSWGGLTKLFEDYTTAVIYSFDRPNAPRQPNRVNHDGARVSFISLDIFKEPECVVRLCRDKHRKLLYCDNGNKILEVNAFAKCLNKGDMLAVHDWPREIYHDYKFLKPAARANTTVKDVHDLNNTLTAFSAYKHDEFLQMGFSTRFWIKII